MQLGQQLEMTKEIDAGMLLEFSDGYKGKPNFVPQKMLICPKPLVLQKYTQLFHEKIPVAAKWKQPPCASGFHVMIVDGRMSKFHSPRCGLLGVVVLWAVHGLSLWMCVHSVHRNGAFPLLEWVEMGESEA